MTARLTMKAQVLFVSLVVLLSGPAFGVSPPSLIDYQGVLRDSSAKPLTGTYDMVFGLYDAASGGNQILLDYHSASAGTSPVVGIAAR